MQNQSYSRTHKPPGTVVLSLIALLAGGTGLLLVLAFVRFSGLEIMWEFGRDLGIALIVSGVIASLFELYRSVRQHIETMRDVIDLTMGDKITPEVWLELRDLIETRKVIRRNVHIRWNLVQQAGCDPHQAVPQIEHEYDIYALSGKGSEFAIEHELDYHMRMDELQLPDFKRIVIDPPESESLAFDGQEIRNKFPDGKISIPMTLQPRGGEPVHVRVERHELVHVPGSYNLYTPELMKGVRIYFGECIRDVEPEICVRPLGRGMTLKHIDNSWSCDHLLLPGQGIEMKFPLKESPSKQSSVTAQ